jgi:excisionase family DNA binding protein
MASIDNERMWAIASTRPAMNKLLSIPEFATLLRVTPSCIRRMIWEKRITIVKVGRLVRIPQTEFDRIVTEGTRAARQSGKA